ncbi:hypothetical protein HMN09_01355500 [Mycena chlorophos]|uniref:Uncharacterized protein n=1 Tax=Mycena chlorophos TaxID=658473 RepID=A0A8H6RYL9_MYCCL|nr:hypothetical protein HMN09_01355500 [Mycena chlorophos]
MALPDELISLILEPALKISEESFANNWSSASPFATYDESTSAYLVVCKSWMRVATPLLYGVVVLRSAAQAQALARALQGNPELGRFIKKLRVEGGFGLTMHTVLQLSPNITDLFLSLDIYATDKTDGLCKGLPLINPRRLIFFIPDRQVKGNKQITSLFGSLKKSFANWDRLTKLGIPPETGWGPVPGLEDLIGSLNRFRRIDCLFVLYWTDAKDVQALLPDCIFREIHVQVLLKSELDRIRNDPNLAEVVKFTSARSRKLAMAQKATASESIAIPSLNPSFVPLVNTTPEIRDLVWSQIIHFVLSPVKQARVDLLLVSKDFYRLGLPRFYTHTVLRLNKLLETHPSLGGCIRTIAGGFTTIWPPLFQGSLTDNPTREGISAALTSVLSKVHNLVEINLLASSGLRHGFMRRAISLEWDTFTALVASAGPQLREVSLSMVAAAGDQAPVELEIPLRRLSGVQKLVWTSRVPVRRADPQSTLERAPLLPSLEHLEVDIVDSSFWELINAYKFPHLRHLTLHDSAPSELFLKSHPITELDIAASIWADSDVPRNILSLCSALVSFNITWSQSSSASGPPPEITLSAGSTAAVLERITFGHNRDFFRGRASEQPRWAQALVELPFESMPKLGEIRVKGLQWPLTQREIGKCVWIGASETLAESNVSLVDAVGKKWRSRLQTRGGKA